jgi:hypothetical protein
MTRKIALIFGLTLTTWSAAAPVFAVTLHHVHGLAYSPDGKKLFIPSHHGLAVYSGGKWSKAPGPEHDYMGFAATRDAFYSSGHPGPGSPLVNPFGLIKSEDQGKTWKHLGLTGESDFHLLATSYATNTVYVFNPHPNSRMKRKGLYFTEDDGKTWKARAGAGLPGEVTSLAVHPTEPNMVAAGTEQGLYLSRDHGESFTRVTPPAVVTSVSFDLDGRHLWFGGFDGNGTLMRLPLQAGDREAVPIPRLSEDAIAYIAQNPAKRDEWAIATFKKDVYLYMDDGKSWKQIAKRGQTL